MIYNNISATLSTLEYLALDIKTAVISIQQGTSLRLLEPIFQVFSLLHYY